MNFIPVLGALVGGLLAILGGVLVARTTDRREKRAAYMEKMEAIHDVATEVRRWADANMQQVMLAPMGQLDQEALKARPPTGRLSVLVDMYEPNLRSEVDRLLESVKNQQDAQFKFFQTMAEAGNNADDGRMELAKAFDLANEQNALVGKHFQQLEEAIVSAVHRRAAL